MTQAHNLLSRRKYILYTTQYSNLTNWWRGESAVEAVAVVRATLPSALNVMNASSVGKLVQLVTASRLTLYHEGRIDPMEDECHYQVKH